MTMFEMSKYAALYYLKTQFLTETDLAKRLYPTQRQPKKVGKILKSLEQDGLVFKCR